MNGRLRASEAVDETGDGNGKSSGQMLQFQHHFPKNQIKNLIFDKRGEKGKKNHKLFHKTFMSILRGYNFRMHIENHFPSTVEFLVLFGHFHPIHY